MVYTCEQLSTPGVGFKLEGTTMQEHLLNKFLTPCDYVPTQLNRYKNADSISTSAFEDICKKAFSEIISEYTEKIKVEVTGLTIDIHTKDKQKFGVVTPTKFKVDSKIDYAVVRAELHDNMDWDAVALDASRKIEGDLIDADRELPLVESTWTIDKRWTELFNNKYKSSIDKFDELYWTAFNKLDSLQWHNYCYQHGYADPKQERVHPAVDFMCWCIDTQDYDALMTKVYDKQVNAKTGIDLFASINTTTQTTTSTPIKESGNTTTMAQTATTQTALTAQTPVTADEQKKFFAGALAIPQIAASEKVWSRTGGTFETIVLHAIDADAFFTCDTKIVKTTGKPSNKKYQWIVVDGEKFSWNNIGDATKGFALYGRACGKDDYADMAKYMTEPSAKKWLAMLNGEATAEQPKVEEPKAETPKVEQPAPTPAPKTAPQFKGVSYNEPDGDGIYHLVWLSSDKCHIYGINGEGSVEVDMTLDKANTERCIAQASLKQIATPEKFYDTLRTLKLEDKKVVKTLDTKPQNKKEQPKTETPKVEQPQAEQTPAPKAARLTIDKRDGGLFISGADADTAEWIMAYVDSINAMKMRQIG